MLWIAPIPLLIWIALLLGRGYFWRTRSNLIPPLTGEPEPYSVAVVIPARNEADVIAPALRSLMQQDYPGRISIFVVDDGSDDGTFGVAESVADNETSARSVAVLRGQPLPHGWTGKLWAVSQGVERALAGNPDFLLLTDADIEHAPDSLAKLIVFAQAHNLSLASLMVRLPTATFAEKALMPAFVFFFFLLYPPRWIANPARKIAGAAGGCILLRPAVLLKAGGISAIRDQIIDDCALARIIKRVGGRVWLGLTPDTVSIRGYGGSRGIGRMVSRTAYNQLRHSPLRLLATLLGIFFTYVLPLALLFTGRSEAILFGAAAWLLMALIYLPIVRFYDRNLAWAAALPAIALFYSGATIYSAIQYYCGRGGEWKGRAQDKAQHFRF